MAVKSLLIAHVLCTVAMTAVIWFVQWVHYPLFALVGETAFQGYERAHVARITWIVAPLMILELGTGVLLPWLALPAGVPTWLPWGGLLLLAVIWGSTFVVQVPLHERLSAGQDLHVIASLVNSNWLRTAAWSLRAIAVSYLLWFLLAANGP